MGHKQTIVWSNGLLIVIALISMACQGPTPGLANSTTLPSPGVSVVRSEPTSTESTAQDTAKQHIATIAAESPEAPPYVQGSSGDELVQIPEATIVYYEIEGSNESDLRAQMDELGPVDYSGFKSDAATEWYVSWDWPGFRSDNCSLDEAVVSYEVKIIFPRWTPTEDAPNNLIVKWFNYTYKLAKHEKSHADYLVANYQSVLDAIKGATCETADAVAEAALEPLRAFDLEYDRQTGHGATQGARFP